MAPERLLLTGAYSFIGSHILDQFMSLGVSIRAVVESEDEAIALEQRYGFANPQSLDFAIVPFQDISMPSAYNDALNGSTQPFDTVIHTVTAGTAEEADCLSRFINLETDTLVNFLKSVKRLAPSVQRVIITSTFAPFARWLVDPGVERRSQSSTPSTQRTAEADSDYILATCRASDNIVNDSLARFMRDERPAFDLVTLSAPSVYGPSTRPLMNISDLEGANRSIWDICSAYSAETIQSPPYGISYYTDVRDFAFAHTRAAFVPRAGNSRFVISSGTIPSPLVIASLAQTEFPHFASRIMSNSLSVSSNSNAASYIDPVDASSAAAILGMVNYRPVAETLIDLMRQLLELERRRDWRRVIQS